MTQRWGDDVAQAIARRVQQLEAVERLEQMRHLPGNCHELVADRAGQLAVSATGSVRLIFEPDHNPVPTKPDGGLDWIAVDAITIVEVVDYH